MLRHPNIIRFYGKRQELQQEYIFMEYAAGGELFNKIGKHLYHLVDDHINSVFISYRT